MTTLAQLQERKQELEAKLEQGDLTVEAALAQIDRAIASRTLKIRDSRERLQAVKAAVESGVDKDKARRINKRAARDPLGTLAEKRGKRILNRF